MVSKLPFKIENDILIGEEDPIDDSCINTGELILNAFKSRPDFIGQVDAMTGEENTFQQMRERSVKCALWLKKLGVQHNDIIIAYTSNHLDTYIPFLATLYIGVVLYICNINKPINLLYHLQAHPKVIFADVDKASTILKMTKAMNISTTIVVFIRENKESEHKMEEKFQSLKFILNSNFNKIEINEFSCTKLKSSKDTAVILLSSGTTNVIRQHVTIPHAFFTAPSNQQIPAMESNDVGLWIESLHWNISLLLTVRAILSYVKAIKINIFLNPKDNLISDSDVKYFCSAIQKYKVNWVFLKNDMNRGFINFKIFEKYDVSSLKQVIIGGRQLCTKVYLRFTFALLNVSLSKVYCLPEAGVITYQSKGKLQITGKVRDSGHVSKNVSLLIADPITNSPLKAQKIGVICCKSLSLTNGYLTSIRGTLENVTDDKGWFHIDDMGFYDSDGNIHILERRRNVITYQNHTILPISIEHILKMHPKVKDACVIPIYDRIDGHHPFAAVAQKEDSKVTEEELIKFVASKILNHIQLRAECVMIGDFPYLPNGYPNRRVISILAKDHKKIYDKKVYFAEQETKL